MSWLRRIELVEPYYSPPLLPRETTSIFAPKALPFPSFFEDVEEDYELGYALDFFSPPSPIKTPSLLSYKLIQRVERLGSEILLQSLSDRVSELESRFDRLAKVKSGGDRKYTWTAEIKGPEKHCLERKYKWTTEIKEGKHKKKAEKEEATDKKYRWTAEIEGKGEISRKYTFTASNGDDASDSSETKEKEKEKKKKKDKKEKKEGRDTRLVEIEELVDHGAVVLRQVM